MKKVTIVIVNWNTKAMLQDCLGALEQASTKDQTDIIVVDNDSSDGSPEMVKQSFPEIKLINSGGNIGFARANNAARAFVNTPFVIFLNPDTVVYENSIYKMIEFMENNSNVGMLGCAMKNPDGKLQELGIQWSPSAFKEFIRTLFVSEYSMQIMSGFLPIHDQYQSGYVEKLYGGCILVRKELLDAVGWFDDRFFMYAEDVDLSIKIQKSGYSLYYLSEAEIYHVGGGASQKTYSNFATLMRAESTRKLLSKYNGPVSAVGYQIGQFTAAAMRYCMVRMVQLMTKIFYPKENGRFENAQNKYWDLMLWSLGFKSPKIMN